MAETHILTRHKYLYSYIDIMSKEADEVNPPTKLAIGKTIVMSRCSHINPTIVKSDDTLVVHGTRLSNNQRTTLAKLFFFNGRALMSRKSGNWVGGCGYFYIGVNSDGDTVLCVPAKRGTPMEITKFKLPLKFDWSVYGVKVPNSALDKAESEAHKFKKLFSQLQQERQLEVDKFNQQLLQLQHELQKKESQVEEKATQVEKLEKQVQEQKDELNKLGQLEQDYKKTKEIASENMELNQKTIASLEHQVQEKDVKIGKSHGHVEELKQQLNRLEFKLGKEEAENAELRQLVTSLENQLNSKDEWVLVN